MSDGYVAALLVERAEYVARNLPDRVAQVDAELARMGASLPVVQSTPTPARKGARTRKE